MEIYFFEITRKSDNKKYSFNITRLQAFEEIDHTTKIYLDTETIIIKELYQDFIKRLITWKQGIR
jgi:hypothetical protein